MSASCPIAVFPPKPILCYYFTPRSFDGLVVYGSFFFPVVARSLSFFKKIHLGNVSIPRRRPNAEWTGAGGRPSRTTPVRLGAQGSVLVEDGADGNRSGRQSKLAVALLFIHRTVISALPNLAFPLFSPACPNATCGFCPPAEPCLLDVFMFDHSDSVERPGDNLPECTWCEQGRLFLMGMG